VDLHLFQSDFRSKTIGNLKELTRHQIVFDSADGHIITDVDGKKYIDMISQLAVMNFGYSHPKIVDAAVEQTRKLPMCNTTFINPLYAKLADRLTKVCWVCSLNQWSLIDERNLGSTP
jgi:ornithine--oxo-acid transaminase